MNKHLPSIIFAFIFCTLFATAAPAQNCAATGALTAPAGGSVTTAATLKVYNSTEAGPNSEAARAAVDLQDDAWRAGAIADNVGTSFLTHSDTTTPENLSAPLPQSFVLAGINVSYDFRDFPTDYRSLVYPCTGDAIEDPNFRRTFLSKRTDMQTSPTSGITTESPRPASLHNPANQPLVYDEVEQPVRDGGINAVVFNFSLPVKGFGAWFGDVETRTDGTGVPMTVRFLDAGGNRIGEDVLIEPRAAQAGCGDANTGCGNKTTRWIGFTDANPTARVRQIVFIIGYQGGGGTVNSQRFSFVGPTIPVTFTAAPAAVGGRVLSASGAGVRNARVTIQNLGTGETRTALTGTFGYYRFDDLAVGDTYLIEVSAKGRDFATSTQVFTLLDEMTDFNIQERPAGFTETAPQAKGALTVSPKAASLKAGRTSFKGVLAPADELWSDF